MKKKLLTIINAAIVSVYVIFLAGSVVRMTGSGMGCPDWPKCFGYYVPPTSEEQLTWKPQSEFKKGAIIIYNQALYFAKDTFTTGSTYNPLHWKAYTKHKYATFNVYHTYTEYINRLSSVVAGFVFLILLWRVTFDKHKIRGVALLCYLAFAGMLFEAWLGKVVVDSFLTPYIITFHMIGGLLIIGLLLRAKFLINSNNLSFSYREHPVFHWLLFAMLCMMVIQILLGTQVRQFVDEQVKTYGLEQKEFRLLNPSFKFYFHRSFTIAVIIIASFLYWVNKKYSLGYKQIKWVVGLLFVEAITGILMYYVDFPFGTQALHLLSGAILFGILLYSLFISYRLKRFNS